MEIITIPKEVMEAHPTFRERGIRINIDKHFIACVASGDLYSEPCLLFKEGLSEASPYDLHKLGAVW